MAEHSTQHSIIVVVAAQSTVRIPTAAPTRHLRSYTHIFKFFQKIFGHFSLPLGASAPHFRTPLLTLHTLTFFSPLHLHSTPTGKRWIPTSNVTPTPKPTTSSPHYHLHSIKSPAFTIYSFFKKNFQTFFGPFLRSAGAQDPIFEFSFSGYVP